LITGGCGFIGSNLVRFILKQTNWKITILDNLTSGKHENIDGLERSRITFIKGDIRHKRVVNQAMQNCDYVVNLAAQAGVIPSIKDPLFDMDVNVNGIINLLIEALKNNIKKFVHASSAAPLGDQEMPIDETKIPSPLSPYGASKLAGEGYCSAFSGSFDLNTTVLRFSNVYGPWSDTKDSVIALFVRQILAGDEVKIYGDGNQTRDFVYVIDICKGIYLSLTKELNNKYNLFQLGTGQETTINSLFNILQNYFSKKVDLHYVSARKGEIIRNYSKIDKARQLLGYEPNIKLEEGIKKTVEWFIKKKSTLN
jgi:UDP-glucose 4-epimerase